MTEPTPRFDFGSGRADPDTFPTEALKQSALRALDRCAGTLADYPGPLGYLPLRTAMARRESDREGVSVDPDHLVLCNGSMQAVTITAHALQKRPAVSPPAADLVLVETFSYPGSLSAFRNLGLETVGVPLAADGMRLDVLEDTLKRLDRQGRQARFIYTISTYQNPTGSIMPRDRRLELIELAGHFGVPVVEDNCYADVHYEGDVEPALYALSDRPEILYTCSLSKILGPGLRLGYVLARPPILEQITERRSDAGSNTLAAAIAAEFYADGIWSHARRVNAALSGKRAVLLDAMERELGELCCWSKPRGGLFVWVRLPEDIDVERLDSLARAAGIAFLPGSAFHCSGASVPYLRLAFGHLQPAVIDDGITHLAGCIRRARTSNRPRSFDSLF